MSEGISVIIPAFNAADFLPEAIGSVLSQTHPPSEIIVVDDGSTDGSASVAARYEQVQVFSQSNGGPAAARNHGIRRATGSHLAFLDADDVWTPDKLQRQMSALESGDADMIFGRVEVFRDTGTVLEIYDGVIAGTMIVTRRAFDRVGEFSEKMRVGEFIDWYARAQEAGLKSLSLPDIVMRRRLHGHNLTRTPDVRMAYFDALRAAIRRRSER